MIVGGRWMLECAAFRQKHAKVAKAGLRKTLPDTSQ